MKKTMLLCLCSAAICFVIGCSGPETKGPGGTKTIKGEFPEVMVGVWETEAHWRIGSKFGIKFERDGSIKKIIHPVGGPINIDEGGVHKDGPEEGTYYMFVMGPVEASYDADTQMVDVKIVVEHYVIQLPTGRLEGHMIDYVSGPISKDGKTWEAERRNHGWLDGADPPPIDLIDANPDKLVFRKLDLELE
jgi:hypothetical protein